MANFVIDGLIVAGVLALIAVPILAVRLDSLARKCLELSDRNSRQAAMLGALDVRLASHGVAQPSLEFLGEDRN